MTVTWYVVRASGLVAFAGLTISVVLGLLMSGGARSARWPRFALEDVHGFAGVVGGVFIALHGLALLVDTYLPFTAFQLVVPGTAPYRPLATAAGVIAAELLAALAVTNRLRRESRTTCGVAPTTSTSPSGCLRSSTASPPARIPAPRGRRSSTRCAPRRSPGSPCGACSGPPPRLARR